ncbi:MAG: GtrA family protein [Candidatus Magasanikbacteria bacterium]|nr:GtrA family protein [Candidatus Magasanikbacteria bacterium]
MREKLKILNEKAWPYRHEFLRYFVVGASAFILDTGSLYILTEHLQWQAVWSLALTQPFILVLVFWANQAWSFGAKGTKKESSWQLIKFFSLALANYSFALGWMWVVHHEFGLNALVARIANILLAVGWNFLLYKYWVYKNKPVYSEAGKTP